MVIIRWATLVAALVCTVLPLPGLAEFDYYAGSELGWVNVEVNDEDFNPILVNAFFDIRHNSGLGAELLFATGIDEDEASQVELELNSHAALYATYSSGKTVTLTLGVGYSETKLDASLRGSDYPGKSTYEGASVFFRFTEKLRKWPKWHASLAFYSLFDNSDIDMWNANLGVQYAF